MSDLSTVPSLAYALNMGLRTAARAAIACKIVPACEHLRPSSAYTSHKKE